MSDEIKKNWIRWPELAYAASLLLLLGMVAFLIRMPRVGVLDTQRVAADLGVEARIAEDTKAWRTEAMAKVAEIRNSFRAQADTLIAQAEKTTDAAEKEKIKARLNELQQSTQATVEKIGRELVLRNEKQMQDFRTRLKPAIDDVARHHRFDVVLDGKGNTGVPYANSRVDVTDEVIDKARSIFGPGPKGPVPPAVSAAAKAPAAPKATQP
jgi:outer membrane protein